MRRSRLKGPVLYCVTSLAYDPDAAQSSTPPTTTRGATSTRSTSRPARPEMLVKNARTGDLAFNRSDRSLWGMRHHNGLSTLVRMPHPYEEWKPVYCLATTVRISTISTSRPTAAYCPPRSSRSAAPALAASRSPTFLAGRQRGYEDLRVRRQLPDQFVFSPDGRYLYGTSYYTGVSNIFRFEFETGEIEAVSNAETGFFRPIPLEDEQADRLPLHRRASSGHDRAEALEDVRRDHVSSARRSSRSIRSVKEWSGGSPSVVDLEGSSTESGRYRAVRLRLDSAYPILENTGTRRPSGCGSISWTRSAFRPPRHHRLVDARSVGAEQGKAPIAADFRAHVEAERAQQRRFLRLFRPDRRAAARARGRRARRRLIHDRPRSLDWASSCRSAASTPAPYQNMPRHLTSYFALSARLEYESRKDPSAGSSPRRADVGRVFERQVRRIEQLPAAVGRTRPRLPLPIKHSSLWLRPAAGYGWGDRDNTFANFYFGAFGNNYVDHLRCGDTTSTTAFLASRSTSSRATTSAS